MKNKSIYDASVILGSIFGVVGVILLAVIVWVAALIVSAALKSTLPFWMVCVIVWLMVVWIMRACFKGIPAMTAAGILIGKGM